MTRYMIEFDRVGRNRSVQPLDAVVAGEADLARAIRTHVRPHLRSRDFDVMLDLDAGKGWLACGMHSGGDFTVAKREE